MTLSLAARLSRRALQLKPVTYLAPGVIALTNSFHSFTRYSARSNSNSSFAPLGKFNSWLRPDSIRYAVSAPSAAPSAASFLSLSFTPFAAPIAAPAAADSAFPTPRTS